MRLLFLTDTPLRAERLARSLGHLGPFQVVDVLDPGQTPAAIDGTDVRAIVSDVSFGTSDRIAALRTYLDALRQPRQSYLCILHEGGPRARAQATALKANCAVPVERAAERLALALSAPSPVAASKRAQGLAAQVEAARTTLTRILEFGRAGAPLKPELVATGATYIESALRETSVRAWLEMVWQFDDATHRHCLLVAGLAAGFAQQLGLPQADCERLTQAALLHDIGKSRIPLAILNKPDRLDDAERAIMQAHPVLGYEMLLANGHAEEMLGVVRWHHELLDGSGYPDGLAGRAIPDLVRLVTVCDIYGALIERRPYKRPMTADEAFAILTSMDGKLDRDLVKAFGPVAAAAGPGEFLAA